MSIADQTRSKILLETVRRAALKYCDELDAQSNWILNNQVTHKESQSMIKYGLKINAIEDMPVGLRLNALIAEEIFNATRINPEQATLIKQIAWQFSHYGSSIAQSTDTMLIRKLSRSNEQTGADFEFIQPYDYSDRIDCAFEVVRVMRDEGWLFDLCDYITSEDKVIKSAGFQKTTVRGEAVADTDALAIARAALVAVREWKKYQVQIAAAKDLENTL